MPGKEVALAFVSDANVPYHRVSSAMGPISSTYREVDVERLVHVDGSEVLEKALGARDRAGGKQTGLGLDALDGGDEILPLVRGESSPGHC